MKRKIIGKIGAIDMSGATPPAAPLSRLQTCQIGSSFASACRASPHSFGPISLRCSGRRLLARAVSTSWAASARRTKFKSENISYILKTGSASRCCSAVGRDSRRAALRIRSQRQISPNERGDALHAEAKKDLICRSEMRRKGAAGGVAPRHVYGTQKQKKYLGERSSPLLMALL
ncbi:MAG: hypothetical protein JSR58_02590 [Verrucomicrobia bacterium]|nr:hypothetical protein [Verrucomicrobiota bacterium]